MGRVLCLVRCFVAYATLSGLALLFVLWYDISYTSGYHEIIQWTYSGEQPWLWLWPERGASVCSLDTDSSSLERQNESSASSSTGTTSSQDHHHLRHAPEWNLASFNPNQSTEDNYAVVPSDNTVTTGSSHLVGAFAHLRARLDYSYHRVYQTARQHWQDSLLQRLLDQTARTCRHSNAGTTNWYPQWVVFSAGVMGAGKTHTIAWMAQRGYFPVQNFVGVDPDQIRHCLPEFDLLVRHDAAQAGDRTRKEAGLLSELLTLAALDAGQSVIVDGSLRDADWYQDYFAYLRQHYPGIKIAIFHVTAPREAVLERAAVC